jgi:hypothetical protein
MPKYPVEEAMLITHVAIKGVLCVATKVLFLILFATLVESNNLAVLSHSLDRSPTTLIPYKFSRARDSSHRQSLYEFQATIQKF